MSMKALLLMLQREIQNNLSMEAFPIEDLSLNPDGAAPPFILLKDGPLDTIVYEQKGRDETLDINVLVVVPYTSPGDSVLGGSGTISVLDLMEDVKDLFQGRIIDGFTFVAFADEGPSGVGGISAVDSEGIDMFVSVKPITIRWQDC